jgi:hypothetical protein
MKDKDLQTLSIAELEALTADQLEDVTGGASFSPQSGLTTILDRGIPFPDWLKVTGHTNVQQVEVKLEGFQLGVVQ